MNRFEFHPTAIDGLYEVAKRKLGDERGFLSRLFCPQEFALAGWSGPVCQVNYTMTASAGTIRGMHLQVAPAEEMKLVSCVRGKIFDVAVDLRKASPTYQTWHSVVLSAENWKSLLLPKGVAHGFQALSDDCEILYVSDAFYSPHHDTGINPLDSKVAVEWPMPVGMVSDRDKNLPMLEAREGNRAL